MPIIKPADKCSGCPFYSLSSFITPDAIIPDSEVLILAQNPGEHEEHGKRIVSYEWNYGHKDERVETVRPQPLIGASGHWLQREFWPLTKIPYANVSRANVIKCRPYNTNELPAIGSNKKINGISVKMLKEAIQHCTQAYLKIPSTTKYIMAMGGISLYSLTHQESITEWRGWVLGNRGNSWADTQGITEYYSPSFSDYKIFSVIHIASLFKSERYYHATLLDFIKFGKLVNGIWPNPLPDMHFTMPSSIPNYIGFDTEYDENGTLEMWSMADVAGNIYVVDAINTTSLTVQPGTTVITQNGLVDIPHFTSIFDVSSITLEDCMLAMAVLWPGEPTNLDYMTSLYGGYNRHKHIRTTHDINMKYIYAGLDADTTLNSAWRAHIAYFKKDRLAYNEYRLRRQPLLHIINRFQQRGVKVWNERVDHVALLLDEEMNRIEAEVKLLTGNPDFNIGSSHQVSKAINEGVYVAESKVKRTKLSPKQKALISGSKYSNAEAIVKQLEMYLAKEEE